ncbi:zinc uptake regulator, Fur family [Gracilibacillus orientalis]|uniref:Zinc uptake regulator, Fur family n=1 Tax=Gracilibacillus orientalis TaxID=334253 RepID=A0A1I4NBH8_9BACI|nr:Fur family transcriptional regulator [Gracilibacillus orientalis]SFM12745.1 zinc uptake regulator, Fur family [Gracilibacillus orientalis]
MNISDVLNILKKERYKLTRRRERMLEIFVEENRYLSAKDILKLIVKDYPYLSVDTIYRNIKLFEELNIIESTELKGNKHYRFKNSDEHHHYIICADCGATKNINMCPMDVISNTPEGFTITHHKFEVYGYCDGCRV